MIFKWEEFICEFKQETNYAYIKAKLSELEDLFEGTDSNFSYLVGAGMIRVEFGLNICYIIDLQKNEMVLGSIDNRKVFRPAEVIKTDIDEALDIIEKDVYNYLGISEKIINKKYENATGIATYTPQPYRRVDDNEVNNGKPLQISDIDKITKLSKSLKKKKKKNEISRLSKRRR